MKIVFISDTHTKLRYIADDIPECDVLVHCGDFTINGALHEIEDFFDDMQELNDSGRIKHFVGIAGNHDLLFETKNEFIRNNIIPKWYNYLQDSEIVIDGVKFYGSPVTPRFCDWGFNRDSHVLKGYWSLIPDDTDVLITHGPPYQIMDFSLIGNQNAGDVELLDRVLKVKPKIHAFGHFHGCYGTKELNGTIFINASNLNEDYMYSNQPIMVEI